MATVRQLQVLQSLESSLKALDHEGVPRYERTATMICERAGESFYSVRSMIESAKKKDPELLSRFVAIFSNAVKMPACLEGLKSAPVDVQKTEATLPPTAREREAQRAEFAIDSTVSSSDVLMTMIKLLKPLPRSEQERVISTASVYYGVGS